MCGGRAWYRKAHLSPPGLRVRRELITHAELPAGLEGLLIVQLSDLHAGPFMRRGDLARAVEMVERLEPDLVVITGDMITHHVDEARGIAEDIARLRAPMGVYAIFGNHDYRDRREDEIVRDWGARGVQFLRDDARRFEVEGGALALVGVEDLEEARVIDVRRARASVVPSDFEVVLCHHPAGALLFAGPRCLAVLSGHTHGTQLDLPLARRAGPAHPGLRVHLGATRLIVSRGLGSIGLPLRIGAPTELVSIELRRGVA